MIFMKHRNLEKAVVLSLILSTGVYGSAWAETTTTGSLWDGENGVNKTVESGDLFIDAGEHVGAGPHGIIDVKKGNLTIDTNNNGIYAGYEKNVQMNIYADNITINSGKNGIFTATENFGSGTVTIGSKDRQIESLTIDCGGQGIDNKSGNVYIYGAENSEIYIKANGTSGDNWIQSAINNECAGEIVITGGNIKIETPDNPTKWLGSGITNSWSSGGTVTLNANDINIKVNAYGINNSAGETTLNSNHVLIDSQYAGIINSSGIVSLNTKGSNSITSQGNYGVHASASANIGGTINIIASENYDANVGNSSLQAQAGYDNIIFGVQGIHSEYDGTINVIADNNNIIGGRSAYSIYDTNRADNSKQEDIINITAGNNNYIGYKVKGENELSTSGTRGIYVYDEKDSQINITSIAGETNIYGSGNGINMSNSENSTVKVTAGTDINILSKVNGIDVSGKYNSEVTNNTLELLAANGTNNINVTGSSSRTGITASNAGQIKLDALKNNVTLIGKGTGIESKNKGSQITLEADNDNKILANSTDELTVADNIAYGDKYAVNASNSGTVDINAGINNIVYGAVYATGDEKNGAGVVNIGKLEGASSTFSRSAGDVSNNVYSATVIDGAGDLEGKKVNGDEVTGMDVVSALYGEEGAQINLSGVNDIRTYYDDPEDEHTSERAVWAYKGANITLDGTTNISTSKYAISPENRDIAIAAGTATKLEEKDFIDYEKKVEIANVNLNYKAGSAINGDILAAYGGVVNITDANAASRDVNGGAGTGIAITGDLLAGNNGKLTVDLGNSGVLIGRADDYGDAELDNGHGSGDEDGFYNPAFSSNILHGGEVTLNMGNGSLWSVQGQSWITNLNTNGNVLIDLTNASTEYESNAHALTVRNLNGDANIKMSLNGDRSKSDMLYIGNGNGTYNIELDEVVYIDDMYADSGEGFKFSGLRFATVGKGSDVDFNVTATDKGFNNIIYTVGKDVYGSNVSNHENGAYNNGDDTSLDKPGNAAVEDLLKDAEQAGAATINTNDIMLLANEPDTGENLDNNENHLNYKLIDMQTVRSDAGETMLNMSRANYSNAIYMDRLNKRLGEARYINDDPEEDEGMWVRVRHDRIGKDEAFRSQNTMYELGYDKRQECDNGKRRVGFAVDYMHGDTGYNDIAGKGEIDRYGLWLYDTWTGNKGHYVDYVAKWGHLSNDFEVYNSEGKVTGDYSNNVFSISAEYGRKKDMGNDWYFEPQAQLQLARVTGADYTTSQGTKVSVDGINSLIGRAGFRIGKDFGEEKQSTLYFKADVLHEFLGDQTIRALDGTTNGWQSVDYENQGTWYDIGIGYAAMLSQSTYAFIDLEQSFGNDNDDTYQINAGVRWTF